MSEDLLKEKELKLLQSLLDELISDAEFLTMYLGYVPPNKLKGLLEQIPECDLSSWDDFETNGWDLYFWFNFKYKGQKFVFSGSWYYGKYAIGIIKD